MSNVHAFKPIVVRRRVNVQTMMELRDLAASVIRDSGMHYKDIAKKTNIGASTISRLASGETKEPRMSTVFNVLLALDCQFEVVVPGSRQ